MPPLLVLAYEVLNDPSNGLNIGHMNHVLHQLRHQVLKSIQVASE
jgi:hypothetical protein